MAESKNISTSIYPIIMVNFEAANPAGRETLFVLEIIGESEAVTLSDGFTKKLLALIEGLTH
jgi:hypothetical protein